MPQVAYTLRTRRVLVAAAVIDLVFGFMFALGAIHWLEWWFLLLLALAGIGLWVGWCAERSRRLGLPLIARGAAYAAVTILFAPSFFTDAPSLSAGEFVFGLTIIVFVASNAVVSPVLAWDLARSPR